MYIYIYTYIYISAPATPRPRTSPLLRCCPPTAQPAEPQRIEPNNRQGVWGVSVRMSRLEVDAVIVVEPTEKAARIILSYRAQYRCNYSCIFTYISGQPEPEPICAVVPV